MTAFIDTNVLVYAFAADARRDRALAVVAGGGVISVQVLNEFTSVLRRKVGLEWPVVEAALSVLRERFPDVWPLTASTHAVGVVLAREHGLSFYDALIVAAAAEAGCDTVITEDMQHGRVIAGLTIRSPFA